ncbi:MAG TPA: hypothetical protein VJU79_08865, partial [Candidatus Dormibacteraeota bacterium]|nr:hypothetical protein [Candidatus Dormibacteraeota bacterium]
NIAELRGDLLGAERALREGVEIMRRIGDHGHLSSLAPVLADVLYAQDRDDEALRLTEEAQHLTLDGDVDAEVSWRRVHAKLLARAGDIDSAVRLAKEAVDFATPTEYLTLTGDAYRDLAVVLRAAGHTDDADSALRLALAFFERKGNVIMAEATRAQLAE